VILNVDSIDPLLASGAAARIVAKINDLNTGGLYIRDGQFVYRHGLVLPIIDGTTCTKLFCETNADKYSHALAKDVVPVQALSSAFVFRSVEPYYHFMTALLPSLFVFMGLKHKPPAIALAGELPPTMRNVFDELLAALGITAQVVRIVPGDYAAKDVVIPYRASASVAIAFAGVLRRALIGPVDPFVAHGPIKLFVRRDPVPNGRLISNQAEIEEFLVDRGYISIDPGSLPIREQLVLFACATHIVGVEGAGMTNIMFADHAEEITMLASPLTQGDVTFAKLAAKKNIPFRTAYGIVPRSTAYSVPFALIKDLGL
jgi:capsular polysaccharide biosynthesis protein